MIINNNSNNYYYHNNYCKIRVIVITIVIIMIITITHLRNNFKLILEINILHLKLFLLISLLCFSHYSNKLFNFMKLNNLNIYYNSILVKIIMNLGVWVNLVTSRKFLINLE